MFFTFNKMANETQGKIERESLDRDFIELARNLGTEKGIIIFTPVKVWGGHDSDRWEDYILVSFTEYHACFSKNERKVNRFESKTGYNIYEHPQIDYANHSEGVCFEVNPQIPTAGCRTRHHFTTGISKQGLIDRLSSELEETKLRTMQSSIENGYAVLKQEEGRFLREK